MEALLADVPTLLLVAGLILVGVDLFVVGMSPLMFVAAGTLLASAVAWSGVVDVGPLQAVLLAALLSVVAAVLGWRPLRWVQARTNAGPVGSDLVGRHLETTAPVDRRQGTIRWSGTEWRARLDPSSAVDTLEAGTAVQVVAVDGVTLILRPDH